MLVLAVGMYRACSTWQYGVAGAILEKHRNGTRLGFITGIYFDEKVKFGRFDSEWGVLKAHDAHDRFAAILGTRQALGLYAYRDLQDVVYSYMHVSGSDFDSVMERGFVELCLNNDRFWRAQPGMLVQNYDDLIANPVRGVEEIAEHLGVILSAGEAAQIAETLSWKANQRKLKRLADQLQSAGMDLAADDQASIDPVSLLHWNHIRSSDPTAGSPQATVREQRLIELSRQSWLAAQGLEAPSEIPAEPDEDSEPIHLASYIPSGVDIRLDRMFRGVKGVLLEFDAPAPRLANASYLFYLRGWRSINIGTTDAPRDRFVTERPHDLNLADRFQPPLDGRGDLGAVARFASATMDRLIAAHRLPEPAVVIFNPTSNVDLLSIAIGGSSWRPQVFVVNHSESGAAKLPGESVFKALGYVAVPDLPGPTIYVRGDLTAALPGLARPLGPAVRYRLVDRSPEGLASLIPPADQSSQIAPGLNLPNAAEDLAAVHHQFQTERTSWQQERDAWQRERDAWERERDTRQRERDAAIREQADLEADLHTSRTTWLAAVSERNDWKKRAKAARGSLRLASAEHRLVQEQVDSLKSLIVEQTQLRERQVASLEARLEQIHNRPSLFRRSLGRLKAFLKRSNPPVVGHKDTTSRPRSEAAPPSHRRADAAHRV